MHVPREENSWPNLLEKLSNTKKPGLNIMVIYETFDSPSTGAEEIMMIENNERWMTPIIDYLTREHLP